MSRQARLWALSALVLSVCSCERQVTVYNESAVIAPPPAMPGAAGVGGVAGFVAQPSAGASGSVAGGGTSAAGGGTETGAGNGGAPAAGSDQAPAPTGLLANVDQAGEQGSAELADIEVLSDELNAIERPAVGTNGVTLLDYQGASRALTLSVRWDHSAERWYRSSGAFAVYNAAYLDQHYSLLHAESYGIYANGGTADLSGDASTYKEFVAASAAGIAWVDYAMMTPAAAPAGPLAQMFGEVVLLRPDGSRSSLTDRSRYRANVALSQRHVAFTEYASTEPGSVGQLMVQDLAGGAPLPVAASANHQDKPAIDGDWLVFEEYVSDKNSVIRAFNVTTAELRDLSSASGFRANADVLGTRVVWEDYREGQADIYGVDLAIGTEQALVTGTGHSAMPRLTSDGLVWIESVEAKAGLLRARWR
jgi:beta propeller repeat protein